MITIWNGSRSWTASHRGSCSPLVGQLGGSAIHPTFPRFPGSLTVIFRLIETHRKRNSITTAFIRSQIVGLPALQCWNPVLCL
jgi:hypothetical protein